MMKGERPRGRFLAETSTLLSLPETVVDIFVWAMHSRDELIVDSALFALNAMNNNECESPIEQILEYAFLMVSYERCYAQSILLEEQRWITVGDGARLRADFFFSTDTDVTTDDGRPARFKNSMKLVVECDGHAFHEKTKEQVKSNNERDYVLKSSGYEVLHFSGSQIFNNPFKCACDVIDFIINKTGGLEVVDGNL